MFESGQGAFSDGEVDQRLVEVLISFGFDRERSYLALKVTQNELDSAVDLLSSDDGSTLEQL